MTRARTHAPALRRIDDVTWEIPRDPARGMRVPARVLADESILEEIRGDRSLEQLANVATLPGIVGHALAMPDIHQGYGFPVGAVAAIDASEGVISPGGVGYDINCGVRLIGLGLTRDELGGRIGALMDQIARGVPSGTGRGGRLRLTDHELDLVLREGAPAVVRRLGLGTEGDLERTESGGCIAGADPAAVSDRARARGRDQLGTLGAGNHFLEVQVVDEVLDDAAAGVMGIGEGDVTALVHTGSRGLGHQVCTDSVRLMIPRIAGWGIELPDRELACAPLGSPEARDYLAAMACAANFAFANRQVLAARIREALDAALGPGAGARAHQVYDVAHNVAKAEEHGGRMLWVHRKGATRAFGPARAADLPADYARIGQPVLVPGSMGTASWLLVGTDRAEEIALASACHGAGRRLSRTQARKRIGGRELRDQLEARGIAVRGASARGLAEEAPFAYKDVDRVVEVVVRAGIARRVARLRPIGVRKG